MSLASVPVLLTILGAIRTVVKTIWDVVAKSASRSAFLVGVIIPKIVAWFLSFRGFTLAICVFLGLQVAAVMRTVFRLTQSVLHHSGSLAFLNRDFRWMFWLLWDGPLNLHHLYESVIPDLIGVWVSIMGIKYLFRKVAWIKFLVSKNFQGGSPV